jgi:hypothetical protein
MSTPNPAALALVDQWEAEVRDVARGLMGPRLEAAGVDLDADEWEFAETCIQVGLGAALVVLDRHGWLKKP